MCDPFGSFGNKEWVDVDMLLHIYMFLSVLHSEEGLEKSFDFASRVDCIALHCCIGIGGYCEIMSFERGMLMEIFDAAPFPAGMLHMRVLRSVNK